MLTAEEFARAKALLCKSVGCSKCVLGGKKCGCHTFQIRYPAEAVKRVELWWNKHKHEFDALIKMLKEKEGD